MTRTPIAIVGCGGMGRRHLTGLAALDRSDFCNVELVAVCDINQRNAEDLADEAERALGKRPRVFTSIAEMVRAMPEIQGADVATDTGSHHRVATECLRAGLHVMVEKPLAITLRGCNLVLQAAREAGRILSVAENYRRDPINRLARALIQDGAIGTPQLMIETSIGGGNQLFITPWRHQKFTGTLTLDAGVHNADILMYYLGDVESAYGEARLYEKYRYKTNTGGPGGFYAKWADQIPDRIEATGEDAMFGYLRYKSGAIGQWIFHHAGHGLPQHVRQVYGSKGSLSSPGDRNGRPLRLYFDGNREIADESILDYAPSYRLSPLAAQLFGGERVWTYNFPFVEIDAKILATEYHEFAECIQTGRAPEVDGLVGRRDTALVYALFESGKLGRPVTLDEIETVAVDAYQREIDAYLGLI
ncbi:MAG TPA: Gfo/Idh/MocA family oxidoreductase [Isosphaeraceae bacterium]|nr:Gfo/Idh/MocA family oxidoreductase [Isosphaeraceae bacterium]